MTAGSKANKALSNSWMNRLMLIRVLSAWYV